MKTFIGGKRELATRARVGERGRETNPGEICFRVSFRSPNAKRNAREEQAGRDDRGAESFHTVSPDDAEMLQIGQEGITKAHVLDAELTPEVVPGFYTWLFSGCWGLVFLTRNPAESNEEHKAPRRLTTPAITVS